MPICTYLFDCEKVVYSSVVDKNLNELLQELNSKSKHKWYIQEVNFIQGFFRKKIVNYYYLYYDYCDSVEVQAINFYIEPSSGTRVTKNILMNFLMGMLSGFEKKE